MAFARRIAALHLVALLLAALTAAGASLPTLTRLVTGDPDHACHCSTRGGHAQCACPLCFPELKDDGLYDGPIASSRCGDDDAGWQSRASLAIGVAPFVVAPPGQTSFARPDDTPRHARSQDAPDPPPPKTVRS